MSWRKLGRVFVPDGSLWWARSYASFPTAEAVGDGRIRVYFTSLDERQDGRVGWIDVDADDPLRIAGMSPEPALDIGALGEFDDCGANAFGIVNAGAQKFLYYQGWQRTEKAPFLIFSGVAVSDDGGASFRKLARVPALDRTADEPYLRGAPFVLRDEGRFRMWYVSGTGWSVRDGMPRYRLTIRVTESDDGVAWRGGSALCVEPDGDEYALGRPCVVRDGDTYRLWYSIRSFTRPYRIGYAESPDGVAWTRRDAAAGIERSDAGWDSEMICYGYVVDAGPHRYLFFNGNRHGSTGFGVARWEGERT
jgi:hypothetical protein